MVAHVSKAELDQIDLERAELETPNAVTPPGGETADNFRDPCIVHIDSGDEETALQTEPVVKHTHMRNYTDTDTSTEDDDSDHGEAGREDVEGEPEVTNDDLYSWFDPSLFFG